jgi:hypothetical protein
MLLCLLLFDVLCVLLHCKLQAVGIGVEASYCKLLLVLHVLCRQLLSTLHVNQCQPAFKFLTLWASQRQQLWQQSHDWWKHHMAGTTATAGHNTTSSSSRLSGQQSSSADQDHAPTGGLVSTMNSTLKGVMSCASSSWQGSSDNSSNGAGCGCPLCEQEPQEQLATTDAAAAAADSPAAAAAASAACKPLGGCRDPFMWRRLVWQLLGRLMPTAQAWYMQHYGMCPHCPDRR